MRIRLAGTLVVHLCFAASSTFSAGLVVVALDDEVPPAPDHVEDVVPEGNASSDEMPETVIIGEDGDHDHAGHVQGDNLLSTDANGDVQYGMQWNGENQHADHSHSDGHDDHDDFHHRPDSHAPAGLCLDHTHEQGQWMVEYKFMHMTMQGMRTGTRSVTPAQAAAGAGAAASPTSMDMRMHMGHIMYGLNDCITLYTMLMWSDLTMDHRFLPAGPNIPFTTSNADFDDMSIGAVIKLYEDCNSEWIGHIGLTVPTGDIGRQVTPGPPPPPGRFPYPMRTGSGHVSLRPGLTYKQWNECGSIGIQATGYIPLHENYQGYNEGSEAQLSFWISRLVTPCTSVSFRAEGLWRDDFQGSDPTLNPALVTTANPRAQRRSNVNLFGGLNTIINGHRLAVEVGAPVYQNVQGFQLEQDLFVFSSWSKAF